MEGPNKEDKWKIEWEWIPNIVKNKDISKIRENEMHKTQWLYWKYSIRKRIKVWVRVDFASSIILKQEETLLI